MFGRMRGSGYAASLAPVVVALLSGCGGGGNPAPPAGVGPYQTTTLVTDTSAGGGRVVDSDLVNPWGIAFGSGGPFWISDNGPGLSTLYDGAGTRSNLVVTLPGPGDTGASAPNGIVVNTTSSFAITAGGTSGPAVFIFSTEDGVIDAWNSKAGATAVQPVDNSGAHTVYKGLAMGTLNGAPYLYATDFHNGKIDVFDGSFQRVTGAPLTTGAFTDPSLPAHYAPFGIASINGELYVTYALQDAMAHDDVAGVGNGFVDVYQTNGTLQTRLVSGGALDSPWGLAIGPQGFGAAAGELLVGNFGNGEINVYDPTSGKALGPLNSSTGAPVMIPGLWGLVDGAGAKNATAGALYFTAGPNGEADGAFGTITVSSTASQSRLRS